MQKSDWAFIQELHDLYERTSLSDIISILPLLIPILIVISLFVTWIERKLYSSAMKRFEEENPHLKGQYFPFWKWFDIKNESGQISTKHYKKRFGDVPFVNTDGIPYHVRHFKERSKGFAKNFSLPTKIAIVVLVAIMASALV